MTDVSSILALPYLQPAQAQKHVTHNEALRQLDVLVQLCVEAFDVTTTPAVPDPGMIFTLGATASGAWAGQADGSLAVWDNGAWAYVAPRIGWRAYGRADTSLRVWDGSAWIPAFEAFSDSDLQNVTGVGINASSDTTNRLAVAAPATLLGHDGDDHRLKINKASASDTAALLFQTAWSGRAEIGCIDGDALRFKLSSDGSSWSDVLTLTPGGNIGAGTTSPGSRLESLAQSAFSAAITARSDDSPSNWAAIALENSNSGGFLLYMDQAGQAHIRNNHAGGDLKFLAQAAEVARLSSAGNLGIGTASPAHKTHVQESGNTIAQYTHVTNAAFSSACHDWDASRAGSAAFDFGRFRSNLGASPDTEFRLAGDGNAYADGSWTGGGADYAEYFEWLDGNPDGADRRGIAVVLEGDKIRPAQNGDTPIGVISGNPSVVGDGDMDRWKGKYLRDDFGGYLWQPYEVTSWTDEEGQVHSHASDQIPEATPVPNSASTHQVDATGQPLRRRRINPAYDPDQAYISRAARPEWDTVGLMGKLRLRSGQPVAPTWIKMRDISDTVEEWLLR